MKGKRQGEILDRFTEIYSRGASPALDAVERRAIGAVVGASGYTTVAQAERLLTVLNLEPGKRLLDIGAGTRLAWVVPVAKKRMPGCGH